MDNPGFEITTDNSAAQGWSGYKGGYTITTTDCHKGRAGGSTCIKITNKYKINLLTLTKPRKLGDIGGAYQVVEKWPHEECEFNIFKLTLLD